jgi:hypothetical protein
VAFVVSKGDNQMSDRTDSLRETLMHVLESGAAEHQARNGGFVAAEEFAEFFAQHLNQN